MKAFSSLNRAALAGVVLTGLALAGMVTTVPAARADDAVIVTVGSTAITESQVQQALKDFASKLTQVPESARRAVVIEQLVNMQLIVDAAIKAKLDETPDYKTLLDNLRREALRNVYIDKVLAGSISDADIKKSYDQQVAAIPAQDEVHARHILVKSKDEAEAIIKQLEGGAKFEDLAKEKSIDGSKDQGGDLGYFSAGMMVPEFEKAAFALKPGEYTHTPVQSQFGFHIIKLEDRRKQAPPALDEVKDQIREGMMREKYGETIAKLKADEKPVYASKADDPAAAQPAPAPAPAPDAAQPAPAQPAKP